VEWPVRISLGAAVWVSSIHDWVSCDFSCDRRIGWNHTVGKRTLWHTHLIWRIRLKPQWVRVCGQIQSGEVMQLAWRRFAKCGAACRSFVVGLAQSWPLPILFWRVRVKEVTANPNNAPQNELLQRHALKGDGDRWERAVIAGEHQMAQRHVNS